MNDVKETPTLGNIFMLEPTKPEVGGKEIMEMLQEPPKTDKFQYVKSVYNDLL